MCGGGGWLFSGTAHCISRNVADARRESQDMNKISPKICKGYITQGSQNSKDSGQIHAISWHLRNLLY